MYEIKRVDDMVLLELQNRGIGHTVFTTYAWIEFLKKDQNIESVVLEISEDNEVVAYFVGGIIKKFGIKIFGSPFAGWLTCDMGFVSIRNCDIEEVLFAIRNYSFKVLGVHYIQIIDKNIQQLKHSKYIKETSAILHVDNSSSIEDVLEHFTKNGRRDVRASGRKGVEYKKVAFDRRFVECYYEQLVDVFAKQNLEPFYGLDKLNQLVEAFKEYPERVCALMAMVGDECIATVFSFGYGDWAYYMGAASYRKYQKYLPNEGLFWEFVKYWNGVGVKNLDLVGYREYKMKYNPTIIEAPVIVFEKFPGLHFMKRLAYNAVSLKRKLFGMLIKVN